jgi:hypothetical protein
VGGYLSKEEMCILLDWVIQNGLFSLVSTFLVLVTPFLQVHSRVSILVNITYIYDVVKLHLCDQITILTFLINSIIFLLALPISMINLDTKFKELCYLEIL